MRRRRKIGQWDCEGGSGKGVLECTLKIEEQKEVWGRGGSGNGRNPVGGHERNFSESAGYESPVDLHVTFVCRRQHITIPGSRGNGVDVTPHTHLCSQIHSRALSQDCVGRGCCCCSRRTCSEFLLLPKPSLCKACILHGRGRHRSLPATALQSGLRGPLRPRFPSSCLPADVFPIKKNHSQPILWRGTKAPGQLRRHLLLQKECFTSDLL